MKKECLGGWGRRLSLTLLCGLIGVLLPVDGRAQRKERFDQIPQGFTLPNKEKRYTSAELLAQFEAPVEGAYRLGAGDQLTVEVWGRPELSGKHVVAPDGRIALPLLGPVPVDGLTQEQAAERVRKAYVEGEYYRDVAATVRVDRYSSNRVFVLGRVAHPGAIEFDTPPTLLEALTRAGSLPIGGIGADKASLTRCAVFRGRDKVIWIDLKTLFARGDLAMNLRLQRDDLIYMPDAEDQLVYVMGQVNRPGAYHLTSEMALMDGLMLAGGVTRDAGDRLRLVRPGTQVEREISLDELIRPHSKLNVLLEEGDILYVEKRNLAKFGYVMERISPFGTLLFLGGTLAK